MGSQTPFRFNEMSFDSQEHFCKSGHRCGTAIPNDLQMSRVAEELSAFRRAGVREVAGATINVQFIHIVDRARGKITEQQRVDQIEVLNNAYNPHGIQFTYDPSTVMEVNNATWFAMGHRSAAERQAKTALQVDPAHNLNFYTGALRGLLGWATFPFDFAGDPVMDGVVILHSSLPGGTSAPYDLGATAVHEIGHWLGLYHTFEPRYTCSNVNDMVADTPTHSDANFGTPDSAPACDPGKTAPVHNYMNYVDDVHMNEFTPGQVRRMRDQIGVYRDTFADAAAPPPPPPTTELELSAVVSGNLGGTDAESTVSVNLPATATITLDGPGGVDFDLYVKRDAPPTKNDYDDRSYSEGPDETLKVTTPGRYFIMARSYRGAGSYTLTITLD